MQPVARIGTVCAIVGVLVACVVGYWFASGQRDSLLRSMYAIDGTGAVDRRVVFDLQAIRTALDFFEVDCGRYPTEEEGLTSLVNDPNVPGWRGPYVKTVDGESLIDEWGEQFRYSVHGGKPVVISAGPDRRFGTSDDVSTGPE